MPTLFPQKEIIKTGAIGVSVTADMRITSMLPLKLKPIVLYLRNINAEGPDEKEKPKLMVEEPVRNGKIVMAVACLCHSLLYDFSFSFLPVADWNRATSQEGLVGIVCSIESSSSGN